MKILMVFLGGGLGSIMRFGLSKLFLQYSTSIPLGTLISNALASAMLALFYVFLMQKSNDQQMLYAFLAIGLCGGFSTFSTFSLESIQLCLNGQWAWLFFNLMANVIICFSLVYFLVKFTR